MKNTFENFIKETGIKEKKFYDTLGINSRTWKRKLLNPPTFSIAELKELSLILRIAPAALLNLILENQPVH